MAMPCWASEFYRDIDIPLNEDAGHRLFAFSAETGLPFQIHYEIEDQYLPVLEEMLAAYPKAKVIWCHLAQARYRDHRIRPATAAAGPLAGID